MLFDFGENKAKDKDYMEWARRSTSPTLQGFSEVMGKLP